MSAYESEGVKDVLNVIFSGSCPESWKENPDTILYLSELSSYGVQRLNDEPERLCEEKTTILEQTQDLAFHNYKTFIQTAECSQEIFQDFSVIEKRLAALLDTIPNFVTRCDVFAQEAQQINTRWHQISLTLSKHPQLLEILEMPQLMDTCVRNGYYEEALELATYVRRLEKKYSSVPLIASIVKDVKESMQLMLTQLLQQLRSNIQLPTCLKVIGYLRRMDVFSERELRIKFLQARDSWFQSVLNSLPKTDAYIHIMRTIEASRINLFDIVTQYRAIFSDDDPFLLTTGRDNSRNESAIFHSWITLKVSEFLNTLETDIKGDLGGRLDSVLSQSMYFGLSFSRVGADFRPLLIPIFQKNVLNHFQTAANLAAERFEEDMQVFTLVSYSTFSSSAALNATLAIDDSLYPPLSLVEFHPLAQFCNKILVAFNDLRLCAPLTIATDLAESLESCCKKIVTSILDFHNAEQTAITKTEEEVFFRFCTQFANELLPFLNRCLVVLFPPTQLAKILGISISEFNKLGTIGKIDINKIISPLQHLLPSKEDEGITINVEPTVSKVEDSNTEASVRVQDPLNSEEKLPIIENKKLESNKSDISATHADNPESENKNDLHHVSHDASEEQTDIKTELSKP